MNAQAIHDYIVAHSVLLHEYGYLAVFFVIMLEDFGIPTPGEITLVAASLIASNGELNIFWVLLCGWLGAIAGDNIGFVIGRYGGTRLLLRYGHHIGMTKARLDHVKRLFDRWGGGMVLGARFIEVARQLNGIVAGSAGMTWRPFLLFNALGSALWVAVWGLGVYLLGQEFWSYLPAIARVSYSLLAVAAGLLLIFWWWRLHHGR